MKRVCCPVPKVMSYGHSPEGFCMKTLFDNDWEGRANRSQHAHGKQRYYQFKWNIFTMMSIYEMSLLFSTFMYFLQCTNDTPAFPIFCQIKNTTSPLPCAQTNRSPHTKWKNLLNIIKRTHIFSLSSVHLYFCCIWWWLTKVEAGLPNMRRHWMCVHLSITNSTLRHISFH